MIWSLKNRIKHKILIKLHIFLWILFGVFSVFDTLWSCTEWGILPYLFVVWIFLFIAFYIVYGFFASKFFIEKKYVFASIGLFATLVIVNFIYTEIQYIIPLDICNKQSTIDISEERTYYWFNIVINLKTTAVLILLAFVLYYLEHSKSEELKQKVAHIDYLKNQISPHYLLNALNDLMFTAIDSPLKVKDEIEELSEWLMFSLYKIDKDYVPLIEEVNHVKLYFKRLNIYIEEERDIHIFENIDDLSTSVAQLNFPPLILFNLAENAVKFSRLIYEKNASIICNIFTKDNYLYLSFYNTIDIDFVQEKKESGIGLSNVIKRLRLFYGDKFDYSIVHEKSYFEIQLKLPL